MHGVLGPGGRGVLVADADRGAAEETRRVLADGGIPAALPAQLGLRAAGAAAGEGTSERAAGRARFWAVAARRPAIASGDGALLLAHADGSLAEAGPADVIDAVSGGLDRELPPRVAVFGGAWVADAEPEYAEAEAFGRRCAAAGIQVVNGGYGGIMAAASRGAAAGDGTVVGVTIGSFSEHVAVNRWLTHEVQAEDLFGRLPLICDADAWVAFPGGVGTLAEIALCWNLIQTDSVAPRPLIIVGERWDAALTVFRDLLLAEQVHFELVRPAAGSEQAFEQLSRMLQGTAG